MGDLIDFGKFAQTAIAFQNMQQNAQALNLQADRLEAQRQQNAIDQQRVNYQQNAKVFDELENAKGSPFYATNPMAQIDIAYTQGRILEGLLGKKIPLPSREEMVGGYESVKTLISKLRNGTPEEQLAATQDVIIANPKWGRSILEDMKKAGEVSSQLQEIDTKVSIHAAQLQKLNILNARYTMQDNLFSEHAAALSSVVNIPKDKQFSAHFQKMLDTDDPTVRDAYLKLHPDFARSFSEAIVNEKKSMGFLETPIGNTKFRPQLLSSLDNEVTARMSALRDAQARDRNGQAPREMEEEASGYSAVRTARDIEAEWLQDPFNKDKWLALNKATQDIRILQGQAKGKVAEVVDKRNTIAQEKFDLAKQTGRAERDLQEFYLANLSNGMGDNQALGAAIRQVKEKYGEFVPFKPTVENQEKKGQQTVTLLSPAERTNIAEERTLVGQLDNLIKNFDPAYVGSIDSRMGRVGQMTGTLSAKREMWLQEGRAFLSEARHKIFGASLTAGEQEAALNELPNDSMGDKQWPAAAKAWRDKWGRLIEERLRVANQSKGILPGQQNRPPIVLPQGYVDQQSLKQELLKDYQ